MDAGLANGDAFNFEFAMLYKSEATASNRYFDHVLFASSIFSRQTRECLILTLVLLAKQVLGHSASGKGRLKNDYSSQSIGKGA